MSLKYKKKKKSTQNFMPSKISFKNEDEIDFFRKTKWREFDSTSALPKMFKEVFPAEGIIRQELNSTQRN